MLVHVEVSRSGVEGVEGVERVERVERVSSVVKVFSVYKVSRYPRWQDAVAAHNKTWAAAAKAKSLSCSLSKLHPC